MGLIVCLEYASRKEGKAPRIIRKCHHALVLSLWTVLARSGNCQGEVANHLRVRSIPTTIAITTMQTPVRMTMLLLLLLSTVGNKLMMPLLNLGHTPCHQL